MSISAGTGIWWRTPFRGSSAGAGLPRDAPGMPHRFLPRCRSGVWRSGPVFHDDTIQALGLLSVLCSRRR